MNYDYRFWIFLIEIITVPMLWFFIAEMHDGFGREEDLERVINGKIFEPPSSKNQPK